MGSGMGNPMAGMRSGMPGAGSGMPGMGSGGPGMGAGMGMGMGMMGGGAGGGMFGAMGNEGTAPFWLFRYFDFEVEPGECYRYRVQLVVSNPSFDEAFVDSPSVAEGETRTTPWSEPSTPAVVEKDIDFALARTTTKASRPDGVELKVV